MRKLLIFIFSFLILFVIPSSFSKVKANYSYYYVPQPGNMPPTVYVRPYMPPTTYTYSNYTIPAYSMPQQQYYPPQQAQQYQPPCYYTYAYQYTPMGYRYDVRWYCPPPQYYYPQQAYQNPYGYRY